MLRHRFGGGWSVAPARPPGFGHSAEKQELVVVHEVHQHADGVDLSEGRGNHGVQHFLQQCSTAPVALYHPAHIKWVLHREQWEVSVGVQHARKCSSILLSPSKGVAGRRRVQKRASGTPVRCNHTLSDYVYLVRLQSTLL